MGRSFYSPEGSGLYVSILVRPRLTADDCLLITPLAAVATSRALEASGCPETAIKWVNDIYVGGKKGAGILVEGSFSPDGCLDHAVVGIGINLYQPDGGFPNELGDIASSFFDGRSVDVNRLAVDLIRELWTLYRALPDRRFMDEYRRRSFLLGESVTVERGGEIYLGKAVDIDDSARLIVECDDGVRRKFDSGEARARGLQI